ncbi:hypothetical protein DFH94DRAFT_682198 [Russula ochroleuca]|uniref:Uncharacterized protein n=1 Tax=Russula ochroleuca TaxID=152965 RepID=A0A9P5T9V8_9AGAM|nr:hypothetical protein DFH94DRAFT_682198 [Russula ochroleuca]
MHYASNSKDPQIRHTVTTSPQAKDEWKRRGPAGTPKLACLLGNLPPAHNPIAHQKNEQAIPDSLLLSLRKSQQGFHQTPQGVVLAWARDTGWRLLCAGRFLRGKRTETEHITFGESEHEKYHFYPRKPPRMRQHPRRQKTEEFDDPLSPKSATQTRQPNSHRKTMRRRPVPRMTLKSGEWNDRCPNNRVNNPGQAAEPSTGNVEGYRTRSLQVSVPKAQVKLLGSTYRTLLRIERPSQRPGGRETAFDLSGQGKL